jgi:hypothetical protein
MFLPENAAGSKAEKERKAAFKQIEGWSLQLIPEPLRNDVTVSVREIQCGDPQCSPIDTAITVVFDRYAVESYVECLLNQLMCLNDYAHIMNALLDHYFDDFFSKYFSGGQGMFGVPAEAKDVSEDELKHFFPTGDVLEKWHRGEEADWPPMIDENFSPDDFPPLPFEVGTKVLCRVGPEDWAPGKIIQLWKYGQIKSISTL